MREKEETLGLDDDDTALDLNLQLGRSGVIRQKTQVFEVAPGFGAPGAAPVQPKAALGTLGPGAVVRVLGERGAYLHVLYDDQGEAETGWVAKNDVTVRGPSPQGAPGHRR
jgi:hypothetical protein